MSGIQENGEQAEKKISADFDGHQDPDDDVEQQKNVWITGPVVITKPIGPKDRRRSRSDPRAFRARREKERQRERESTYREQKRPLGTYRRGT